jgi:dihydrofolate synthase/folylpolyglutamate synthase
MVAFSLRAAGYRVGLYTSPHLDDFRDRIRIISPIDPDGRISRDDVIKRVDTLRSVVDLLDYLTWYELVTALAFLHFQHKNVDVGVIEVGLGGRLDATNVITPLVSVITSISFDHTFFLGDSLAEIAREKGGIIKSGIPVVIAHQENEALQQLQAIARKEISPVILIGQDWEYEQGRSQSFEETGTVASKQSIIITKNAGSSLIPAPSKFVLGLLGKHQQENAVVSLATLDAVWDSFPAIRIESIREGLSNVIWPGRLQILSQGGDRPTLLLDCAHNVDSAEKLAAALLDNFVFDRLLLIFGVSIDKDVAGILERLLPLINVLVLTTSSHPRAMSQDEMQALTLEMELEVVSSTSVGEAVRIAYQMATPKDLICATGSMFVVGDLLNQWEVLQSELIEDYQIGKSLSG